MSAQQAVIVGAGHAGAMAAIELRKAGWEGRVVLVGDEAHLPYERPPLSKDLLVSAGAEPQGLHAADAFAASEIDLALGRRVAVIDRAAARLVFAEGEGLAYDRLLLAPGGTARELPVPGGEHARTLRTLDDARRLQADLTPGARVVIVGAGVIGLEVASSARKLGCAVTVLEAQAGPMARSLDRAMQDYVAGLHRRNGVTLEFGVAVAAIEPRADGSLAVLLADGTAHPADVVVAGIGLRPSLELAQNAGLEVTSGIVVDPFAVTSDPAISAAGDATSFYHPGLGRHVHWQTWQHAQNHGKAAARAMAGTAEPYAPPFWFWSDQFGINIQVTGTPTEATSLVLRGDPAEDRFAAFHMIGGRVVGATLVNQGGLNRPSQQLIQSGIEVDPAALADPAVALPKLLRR
ncbi:FAD-dependent oxidoreductase [Novosphingobium flavum]|uniref:FAD-dependent oxidoreductase n=1 Tax=Novosphingobium flavum TaxID=1778672 RepID=A0A7X1KNA1_9SPHN|nr:FAD-dependent oxidoreductase [Novosphingobium flavum]MBC2667140.1 FAD-dependent oxidoreductase [Novosphingobium flavum]